MVWVEVLDHYESHAVIFGHIAEELLQCLKPACRGADAYDGELTDVIFRSGGWPVLVGGGGEVVDLESFTNFLDVDFRVFMGFNLRL